MRVITSITLLLCIFMLSSCATTKPKFHVSVDSISAPGVEKKHYLLLPGNKDVKADDLQFKEFATYVHRALTKQGFVPAESFEEADVVIFLMYGIGDPQEHQFAYSIPTWGQTGVASSQTTGTMSSFGNYGSYSETTTYTPTYGITGSTTHIGTYVTYFRYMVLDAVDLDEFRKTKKVVKLWKTTVTSTGSSNDLRLVFPVLVAASKQYIATNTGQKVTVELYESDEQVVEIKGIVKEKKQ